MICKMNCLSCPYGTCERERREKENYRRYYQKHKKQRLDYQHSYNATHKEERTVYNKKRWAERKKS